MQEVIVPEAVATLKNARISARKVKIVADLIRGKDVKTPSFTTPRWNGKTPRL